MRMSFKLLGGFATLLLAGVSPSVVYPVTVTELTNHTTDNTLYPGDTRADGATSEVGFVNDFDQTLSTKLEITGTGGLSASKVAPFFYSGASYNPAAPVPIGSIGYLTSLTYDWYRESPDTSSKLNAWYVPVARIYLRIDSPASPTGELIWENAYNESYEFTLADDTWSNDFDVVDKNATYGSSAGRFYLRADPDGAGSAPRQNYGDSSGYTLAQWLAPVTDTNSTRFLQPGFPTISIDNYVYGATFSVGSAAPTGVGYVDDVTFTFIPEPASLSLLAAGGLLILSRRRA